MALITPNEDSDDEAAFDNRPVEFVVEQEKIVMQQSKKAKRSGLSVLQKLKQEGIFEDGNMTKSDILPEPSKQIEAKE